MASSSDHNSAAEDRKDSPQQQQSGHSSHSYQAGRDIVMGSGRAIVSSLRHNRLARWLAGIVAVLSIVSYMLDLPQQVVELLAPEELVIRGRVVDSAGAALAGASVELFGSDGEAARLAEASSDEAGEFVIHVGATAPQPALLTVSKDGVVGYRAYVMLPEYLRIIFVSAKP